MAQHAAERRGKKTRFQVMLLSGDADLSVSVTESDSVDFKDVKRRLDRGNSVFITSDPNSFLEPIEAGEPKHLSRTEHRVGEPASGPDLPPRLPYVCDD